MALDSFMQGAQSGLSNTLRMFGLVGQMRNQKRVEEYREGLQEAVNAGDLQAGRDLAMGMGDAQTAQLFDDAYEEGAARDFDRLARMNPDAAKEADPSRWAMWHQAEETRRLGMEQAEATLAGTKQGTDFAAEDQGWRREDRLSAKETQQLTEASRGFLARIDNNAENVGGALPYISRLAKQNPKLFQKAFALGDHRIPQSFEMVDTPDGPRITMRVFNEQTGTVGPVTEGQSAGPGDNVISLDPESFVRMVRQHANLAPPKPIKGRFEVKEVNGRTVRVDTVSGEVTDMGGADGGGNRTDALKFLSDHVDDMFRNPSMMESMGPHHMRKRESVRNLSPLLLDLGYDQNQAWDVLGRVGAELRSQSDLAKAFMEAESTEQEYEILSQMLEKVGVSVRTPTVQAEGGIPDVSAVAGAQAAEPEQEVPDAMVPEDVYVPEPSSPLPDAAPPGPRGRGEIRAAQRRRKAAEGYEPVPAIPDVKPRKRGRQRGGGR